MLSVKEAARRLGVPERVVRSWCRYGLLPHYRFGTKGKRGCIRVDPDELEGFIAGMMPQEAPNNPADVLSVEASAGE